VATAEESSVTGGNEASQRRFANPTQRQRRQRDAELTSRDIRNQAVHAAIDKFMHPDPGAGVSGALVLSPALQPVLCESKAKRYLVVSTWFHE
jgi:hypothetical protein